MAWRVFSEAGGQRGFRTEQNANFQRAAAHPHEMELRAAHPKQEAIRMATNRAVFGQFHPKVYGTAVGLVVWFALAAWILFDRQSDISLPLGMVSVLLLVAVLLPWSLSLVWKRHRLPPERDVDRLSFNDWKTGDFAVWGSRIRSIHAAIDMLLPLAAVALGLTGIGIVFLISAYNAP
ncbi:MULTISPECIES: hypothetical protein [unclassified Bradyrhizobium]|uniref:hypothetical protein n=1 Tax=unclassified Bradyrhizobium TaxID=2631580 RepID=UPI002FEF6019